MEPKLPLPSSQDRTTSPYPKGGGLEFISSHPVSLKSTLILFSHEFVVFWVVAPRTAAGFGEICCLHLKG